MTYSVKEIYYTLQGEGANTGRPAVFCRFSGCNLWTGKERHRAKAICQFCDTEFVGTDGPGGGRFLTPLALAQAVARKWPGGNAPARRLVVCTGGRPLLQLDEALVGALHVEGFQVAVETNGTLLAPNGLDWICVSPKAGAELVLKRGNELKLVFPQERAMPERFEDLEFEHFFIQPMDGPEQSRNTSLAIEYCLLHPPLGPEYSDAQADWNTVRVGGMYPATMTVISSVRAGGPEVLIADTRPVPSPATGEVLIKVAFAGVNRTDCEQRTRGFPPLDATDILGLEVAGEVVATWEGTTRWKPGDRVCALVNGGGYAQYCIAAEPLTLPIPAGFDLKEAAALPEALFTAWLNVFMLGRLKAGEWLLVHGGSSGVGTMAIQLARLEGANVIATAGSDAKCEICVKLGAASAINYREQDFVAGVQRATGGHGADVILDMVGASYARRNLDALATDGRLIHIRRGDGAEFCVPFDALMIKRAVVTGSRLRISELSLKIEIVRQVMERVWPHLGTRVMPVIDSVFPLEQAAEAHIRMESSVHIGKIVLEVAH